MPRGTSLVATGGSGRKLPRSISIAGGEGGGRAENGSRRGHARSSSSPNNNHDRKHLASRPRPSSTASAPGGPGVRRGRGGGGGGGGGGDKGAGAAGPHIDSGKKFRLLHQVKKYVYDELDESVKDADDGRVHILVFADAIREAAEESDDPTVKQLMDLDVVVGPGGHALTFGHVLDDLCDAAERGQGLGPGGSMVNWKDFAAHFSSRVYGGSGAGRSASASGRLDQSPLAKDGGGGQGGDGLKRMSSVQEEEDGDEEDDVFGEGDDAFDDDDGEDDWVAGYNKPRRSVLPGFGASGPVDDAIDIGGVYVSRRGLKGADSSKKGQKKKKNGPPPAASAYYRQQQGSKDSQGNERGKMKKRFSAYGSIKESGFVPRHERG